MNNDTVTDEQILTALSDIYVAVNVFNLRDNTHIPFKTNKYILQWIGEFPDDLQKQSDNVVLNITVEDDIDKMLTFVDLSTLDKRLQDRHSISEIFQGKLNGWCRARFTVVDYDENGKILHVIYSVESINEEKKREHQLMYLSQTDLMTDISNRGFGEKAISTFLAKGVHGLFCLLDVDKFKNVNDKYGHDIGDKVLIALAEVLKKNTRADDVVMRLGGDEFATYFVGIDSRDKAERVLNRLFDDISNISIPPMNEGISVSIGTCFFKEGVTFDEIYKEADKGVYQCKSIPGNSVHFD